ncbi:uncharacterized protein VTP21DRAFT_7637 [Calcarisporiella thermophila]|uniref:uncharacterized protein n=1 Tax=Calcarisporiella thermophila TaxID=911321 RepID=UPI003743EF88
MATNQSLSDFRLPSINSLPFDFPSPSFSKNLIHSAASVKSASPSPPPLPKKPVTEQTFTSAYVDFILHVTGSPVGTNTDALRRSFLAMPRSDGKQFHPWALFRLCQRMHEGEIKSWVRLAIELGVERTDEQSPQKIQQYAVRLKKWMRSMHVDAFFDYLMDVPNRYYLPSAARTADDDAEEDGSSNEDQVLKLLAPRQKKRVSRLKRVREEGEGEDIEIEEYLGGEEEEGEEDEEDGDMLGNGPRSLGSPSNLCLNSPSRYTYSALCQQPAVASMDNTPRHLARRWSDDPWRCNIQGGGRQRTALGEGELARTQRFKSLPSIKETPSSPLCLPPVTHLDINEQENLVAVKKISTPIMDGRRVLSARQDEEQLQELKVLLKEKEHELSEKTQMVEKLLWMVEEKERQLEKARKVQQSVIELLMKGGGP